ncbi:MULTISPECIES: MlaD family protein [Novosphingobium]|uniref:Phospholipid/cholesterol/gamma-HCH transport system substrate-binding protein n=1 Tax=Novosphingobium mathurense TaxID=428990 RepID=A0A1U6GSV2_9SPHN|nr:MULTISPECIES: MlaD family protein [Novosphingobium]CDO38620.1 ABC-type transport system periplasmic component [Novosphingobium sp. KN65.2]SLJ86623.1 phospholipid/cholesterol/gamma-HCH transport system substrate-binding protein [Novosphingobium mathurense]
METRANNVWVGAVTLVLLALLAAFIIWIARLNEGERNEYDIFFKQSVDGLAKGSEVNYAGVPVGQISQIELWPKDPSFVRVRIKVDEKVPVTVGTSATIQGSFTGVSDIQLEGAVKGAPMLTEPGPEGVPVIPTKRGGLGEILSNAPLLLERLATLTESLNQLLSEENRRSITGILSNTDKMTRDLSRATPQIEATVRELEGTLEQATKTLAAFEGVATKADSLLGSEGNSLAAQLRATLSSAQKSMDQLDKTMETAQPALRQVSQQTLPAAEAAIRDLRATSKALRNVTEKIDEQGAGALLKGQKLPDYKP